MGTVAVHEPRSAKATQRYLMVIPLGLLCILAIAIGYSLTTVKAAPSVQLGAPAEVPGGVAMITGIVPLEVDGWRPPSPVAALGQGVQAGAHRVRVEVQFTALDPGGIRLDPAGFIVDGLGSGRPVPLWSSPDAALVHVGESVSATMVFELPNKAIALVLEGPTGGRLSLGKEHHAGG